MIVRPPPTFLQLLYVTRGSVVPKILPQLGLTAAFAALVVLFHEHYPALVPSFAGVPFALLGIALSVFLGFRNNACYDRWWEARKQWGEMISVCRSFGRQTLVLEDGTDAAAKCRRDLLTDAILFVHALAIHLRPGRPSDPSRSEFDPRLHSDLADVANRPEAILRRASQRLALLNREGQVSDVMYQTLDRSVAQLGGVQAACERIRTTPLPFAYSLLLHRTAYLFCFLFPLGFADSLGWLTPFCSVLVAYTFFGLDALGVELENPFDNTAHAIPLSAMARTIEISLLEAMGEKNVPAVLQPSEFVLM
ncbi:bestrophin family ion channel [Sinorhizobium sp. BG8]|uniref:bestrophin family protein n=1 Tax=Sinorhizobium sp. BG8 TaxID=2613773 RepID=UPI00193D5D06|nr:bestrophin family ion channel [Sinorhizobium sp. BG8]QRM54968.1 bestrophin [Sinorhizobium sp. BG8]